MLQEQLVLDYMYIVVVPSVWHNFSFLHNVGDHHSIRNQDNLDAGHSWYMCGSGLTWIWRGQKA